MLAHALQAFDDARADGATPPRLSQTETDQLFAEGTCAPILVLNRLRRLAFRVTMVMDAPEATRAAVHRQLGEQLDALTGAWGAMERINATPLPYVYVVHLRTFLILYLLLWIMVSLAQHDWTVLPTLLAASWALLGIDAASVECERPFKWEANHLKLGGMCVTVARGVAQTLRDVSDVRSL